MKGVVPGRAPETGTARQRFIDADITEAMSHTLLQKRVLVFEVEGAERTSKACCS